MNFYDDIGMYGNQTAIVTAMSEHISYERMLSDADELAEQIGERCLVFSICTNRYESVFGYIGFLRARVVPIMISENINSDLLLQLMKTYQPRYIWSPRSRENDANLAGYIPVYEFDEYVLLKTSYQMNYPLHEDLALLLTTSGSTGSPKLVRLSYRNIASNAEAIAQYLDISQDDKPITTMPMSYTYGLSIINSHLLRGASIILTERTMMEKEFWALLKEEQATTFGGVPYIYEMLKKLRFSRMNLPSLRVLTQAGGKLSADLAAEFARSCADKGMKFIVMYGQTEATARMSYLPWEFTLSKPSSIGIAIPGGQFALMDDDGQVIDAPDTAGELIYYGANVSMGYAENCHDLCKEDENGGRLATGDLAMRDSDGFYYIVGRKKRFLKLFGNRVNLDEVERALRLLGYDCACAGEDDHLRVFVATDTDSEAVRKAVLEHTNINPKGFGVYQIDTIPRNEAGKILYSKLAGMAEAVR